VVVQHLGVVHLVDVVAREDQRVFRPVLLEGVDVLEHRVSGALVPAAADALLRRDVVDELAQGIGEEREPPPLDVTVQGVRLVLGQDVDLGKPRVHAVREGEVDDSVHAAEGNRGLRPVLRERIEALTPASGQDYDVDIL
jgi:hypothetical protein